MRKNLLSVGVLLLGISLNAQFLSSIKNGATVTILSNTLVYNGGGIKVEGTGQINNSGNVMVEGSSTDKFETTGVNNFVLTYTDASSYGQLYINGITQTNLTGKIDKQYREVKHGAYQQIGIPFIGKSLTSLNTEFSKTFVDNRYSGNEMLYWDNPKVLSRNLPIATITAAADATRYYMLGASGLNLDVTTRTLVGTPFANGISTSLSGGGAGINFGGGGARNIYNEKYNTYIQDPFVTTAFIGNFGYNLYQYANPYFTNLDLSDIGLNTANSDDVFIANLQGVIIQPSQNTVVFNDITGSRNTSPNIVTFSGGLAAGDVNKLVLKPLQAFAVKLTNGTAATLNFDKLRRFKNTARATTNPYSVTAAKNGNAGTLKQLGLIALDADGKELGRTYYIVYNNAITGHNDQVDMQATSLGGDVINTMEENVITGGIDTNYANQYKLYINEANEQTFKGKPIPLALYGNEVKQIKIEIREDAKLVNDGVKELSSGIGFFYQAENGEVEEAVQGELINVRGDQYSLFYGKPEGVLAVNNTVKPSRTLIVYNPAIDNYIVRFDPEWKKADVQVFDLSGKLVYFKKDIKTDVDFTIKLNKENRGYVVTAISEKGDKAVAKIIR